MNNEVRLIDANAILDEINNSDFDTYDDYNLAFDLVDSAPTIEAEPVRHGRWIDVTEWRGSIGLSYHKCSECGTVFQGTPFTRGDGKGSKFCEECGAKMDGGKNNDT